MPSESKTGVARRLRALLDKVRVDDPASRGRLERILDENPGIERHVDPDQLLFLAQKPDPIASLSPEEFLQAASTTEDSIPLATRAQIMLDRLKKGEKLRNTPRLDYEFFETPDSTPGVGVLSHDGRARATALGELGLSRMPVQFELGQAGLELDNLGPNSLLPQGRIDAQTALGTKLFSRDAFARRLNEIGDIYPEDRYLNDTGEGKGILPLKKRAFAEGGKVKTLQRLKDRLEDFSMWGHNSPTYAKVLQDWDPEFEEDDLTLMGRWADGSMWGWKEGNPNLARIDELIKKYGIRPRNLRTYRGLELPPDVVESFKPGDVISTFRPQSVSTELEEAEGFAHIGNNSSEGWQPTLLRIAPSERKMLPLPQSGQSELLIPGGDAGKLGVNKVRPSRLGGYEIEVDPVPHPGFAEGGKVLPSSQDESWTDTYLKRPLSGLASMWGGTDPETGEFVNPVAHNIKRAWNADERRRRGQAPQGRSSLGIVDETLSIPALGGLVGLPVPEFAENAEERASSTRTAARDSMGLDAPHGFTENLTESAGVMAGQLPIPASIANKLKLLKNGSKAGKMLSPAVEWFSPTVVPQAGNYLKGSLFGGALGGGLDYAEDYLNEQEQQEQHQQFISEAMAEVLEEERQQSAQESGSDETDEEAMAELGFAEGGRVKTAKRALGSLRSILTKTDADDIATRKAHIDQALHAIQGTAGPSEMDRKHMHTLVGGLSDAASDPSPARRRQRFGDYESNMLALLESRVAPQLTAKPVPADLPVSNMAPPPALPSSIDAPARGILTDDEWAAEVARIKGYAKGGTVNMPWGTPQSQKEVTVGAQNVTPPSNRQGAPLSQSWYETYGEGPEHLFMGERKIPALPEGWTPQRQGTAQTPAGGKGGSSTLGNLAGLASLGLIGWDMYKDMTSSGLDESLGNADVDLSGTEGWIDRDLGDMEMPTAEFDPSVWERTQQGAGGALDLYVGSQQGGVGGAGTMLQGSNDLYEALSGGENAFMERAGLAGQMLSNLGDGSVKGYIAAGGDAAQLAQAMGYSGPVLDSAGNLLPVVGQLFSAYEGIKRGDPAGYAQAAGSLYGAASTAGLTSSTGALASSGLGVAAPLAAAGFAVAGLANQALGVGKKGAYLDTYLTNLGGRRATVQEAKKMPGGYKMGYYILPDGRMISNGDLKNMYKEAGSPFGDL